MNQTTGGPAAGGWPTTVLDMLSNYRYNTHALYHKILTGSAGSIYLDQILTDF
jgi:hypothetical protein